MTHGFVVSDRRPRGMGRALAGALVVALAITTGVAYAAPRGSTGVVTKGRSRPTITTQDNDHRSDANSIDMWVTNHGSFAWDITTGNSGLIFPKGTQKTAVFAAGLWLGGKVNGQVRTTVAEYSQEYAPGPMKDGTFQADNPDFRVYKIDRGQTASADYLSWQSGAALAQGAPVDSVGNPLLLGDQSLWSVYNDANPKYHTNDAGGSVPLGIQVEQTAFQYARQGALGNAVIMIWKLKNLGGNTITDAYVSVWSDPDLGGASDDLVGCDPSLGLGYVYNATATDNLYGAACPSVGFDFLQGPIGDSGTRLAMTSFNKYINGTDPHTTAETYNYMQGLNADGSAVVDEVSGDTTTFQVPGDPVANTGWLDTNPADRRLMLSAGPFTFEPDEEQVIVAAIIVGQGADRLSSITLMKQYDTAVQEVFDQNFDIPSPPPGETITARPLNKSADLLWGAAAVGDIQTSEPLNQEFHFEGYNVYQGASVAGPWKKIATFDEDDDIATTYADVFNPVLGGTERVITQNGTNGGLQYHMLISQDAIRGGSLINGKDYYFAVTSYSYDVRNLETFTSGENEAGTIVETLESSLRPIHVVPGSSGAVLSAEPDHVAGTAGGSVSAEFLDQAALTGHAYEVRFRNGGLVWDLVDTNTGQTVIDGETDESGSYDTSKIVDGMLLRVIAPDPIPQDVVVVNANGSTSSVLNKTDPTGTWKFIPNSDPTGSAALSRFIGSGWAGSRNDYEMRFQADSTEYAWDFSSDGVAPNRVPVSVWNIGQNSFNNPSDDVRVSFLWLDNDGNHAYNWGDGLYLWDIPYDSVDWPTAEANGTIADDIDPSGSLLSFRRLFVDLVDTMATSTWPAAGTVVRLVVSPPQYKDDDVYRFTASKPGTAPGTVVGQDLSKVRVVPNPYINRSSYELNQFDRVMKFTNLPASRKVTIRIFNLAGDLIRTLTKDATTSSGGSDASITSASIVQWDLNTAQNLPVASGIYLYHVDVEGVGETKGQMIIFTEKERLDTY